MTGSDTELEAATAAFEAQRPYLRAVAYRLLGHVGDAEDVLQEAWLRWREVDRATVMDNHAYLTQVTTRLAIDRLRREQRRRETYVGPWLPEPLALEPDVADRVELADSVEMALLVVLETWPRTRGVRVARGVRGALRGDRARRGPQRGRRAPARAPRPPARRRAATAVRRRCADPAGGDSTIPRRGGRRRRDALMELLAPDVTLVSDGGGVVARGPPADRGRGRRRALARRGRRPWARRTLDGDRRTQRRSRGGRATRSGGVLQAAE